jgi:hypothetical protein
MVCPHPAAALVPGWEGLGESGESCDVNSFILEGVCPFDSAEVPFSEGDRFGLDDEVFLESGRLPTHFGALSIEDEPQGVALGKLVGEVETRRHPLSGELVDCEIGLAPCVQQVARIGVFRRDLKPAFSPLSDGMQHITEMFARLGKAIKGALAGPPGPRFYEPESLQFTQACREKCSREAGCSFGEFAVCGGSVE